MRIQTKLTLGLGWLFLLILLMSIVSASYVYRLKADTENVLKNNYRTLEYSRNILDLLDRPDPFSLEELNENLEAQEQNITEPLELEVTGSLRENFTQLSVDPGNDSIKMAIRRDVLALMDINMAAIEDKGAIADQSADEAVYWIVFTGILCFVFALALLFHLPAHVARPIRLLNEGLSQIARHNYAERVQISDNSEFESLANSFNQMAEVVEEYAHSNFASIMLEKRRVETLIQQMSDPVIGLDDQYQIVFANEEAEKILGIPAAELIGVGSVELACRNDLIAELISDLQEESANADAPNQLRIFANGKESFFERNVHHISIVPAGESLPLVVGHVIILRNVTEYKALDSAKTNFIANVSHEFKTPISSLQFSLQLLENVQVGPLNSEQATLINSMKEDAQRLLNITGELLKMTQVESGHIQLSIMPSNLSEIIDYAIQATRSQAEQRNVRILLDRPELMPDILVDTEKTAWVLINLISNAIRYSYDYADIHISVHPAEGKLLVAVKDSGQGIAPQYKEKIFERYFRVPGTQREGTGLGLAISKVFIEAQGGSITVESELGVGSTFKVWFNTVAS